MDYSKEAILQGRKNQESTTETPETFATIDGSTQVRPTRDLDTQSQRMAGEVGARALQLMTNPDEIARTAEWMTKFKQSAPASIAGEWKAADDAALAQAQGGDTEAGMMEGGEQPA